MIDMTKYTARSLASILVFAVGPQLALSSQCYDFPLGSVESMQPFEVRVLGRSTSLVS